MDTVNVGIIGCGAISGAYLKYAKTFPILKVVACADLNMECAQKRAAEFNVPRVCSVKELLADESVQIVVNLTVPKAHGDVALAALKAGKHVYNEKPLAMTRAQVKKMLALAQQKNLRIGCAPDTFLGAGQQTCRQLLDQGAIGKPVAAIATMLSPGVETWHPNPEFYYKPGGGPMLDMGPYYLTAMINLLGPIKRVMGLASVAIPQRLITSQPFAGKTITVDTPDHIAGSAEFENGAILTIVTSFATKFSKYPPITLFGTQGTMMVPDPNHFDKPVLIQKVGQTEYQEVPYTHRIGYGRSVGVADMAYAIRSGRPHRASGQLAAAVLDAMLGFLDSSAKGKAYAPVLQAQQPAALPTGLPEGVLDI